MRLRFRALVLVVGMTCACASGLRAQSVGPASTNMTSDQLAAALMLATDVEREQLVTQHQELITKELIRALNKLNRRLVDKGEYPRALSISDFIRKQAEKLQDQSGIAQALYVSGVALTFQGEYKQALQIYRQSLELRKALGEKAEIASSLNALGYVSDLLGDFMLALDYHQQSLALRESVGDKGLIGASLNNIGIVYDSLGEFDRALDYYQRSLALRTGLNDKSSMAQTIANIGVVYQALGDHARAAEQYQKALELLEGLDEKRTTSQVLYDFGVVYKTQGDFEKAMDLYRRSLALKEALGNKAGIATTLTAIGAIYDLQDKRQQSLDYYQQALKVQEAIGNRSAAAITLTNIGTVEEELGHPDSALEYYLKSLALSEELKEKRALTLTLVQLANLSQQQGRAAPGLEYALRAVAISKETNNREQLWQALGIKGRIYRLLNQPERAKDAFSEAITIIEDLREHVAGGELEKERFFEDKLAPYYELMEMLLTEGRANDALAFAERAKARVLFDVLQTGRVNVTKAMTSVEQEQERRLNSQLSSLNQQIEKEQARARSQPAESTALQEQQKAARLAYESFQASLYAAHPDLKIQRGQVPPFTPADAQSLLDPHTALLEYVLTDERAYLFVLTREGPAPDAAGKPGPNNPAPQLTVYTLAVKGQDVTAQVTAFRGMLAERNLDFQGPARKLYDLLLKPAEKQLAGKSTLCIVPDGALWELPFQALQPNDGRYLWDSYAIFYAPSLSVLRRMREQHQTTEPSLLAFGNPLLSGETEAHARVREQSNQAAGLIEAEKEVETLATIYGPNHSLIFTRAQAREATFKKEADRFSILHFATHSTLDDRAPMYSHIALARDDGDTNEDGLLEAREILKLNLHADLVTLSACQTARGRVGAGEGMIGMSWAFFVAGSPNLLASQWRVDSASTTDLMIAFHRRIATTGVGKERLTKAAALRAAAQELMKDHRYRHPFYWAGFVLIGDGL